VGIMAKKKKTRGHRIKTFLIGLVLVIVAAHFYINNANAQQVKYTPTESRDTKGNITECGFEFVASLPDGYGMQGIALFTPYSHLDFDVSAGKFKLDKLDKLDAKDVTLLIPGNVLLSKPGPFYIYRNGQHLKKFELKRINVNFSLVQSMLSRGFKVSYIARDNTKIEVDFPKDGKMFSDFMGKCKDPMLSAAREEYLQTHKDLTCWDHPEKCTDEANP
jgi:hypothetical protein